MTTPLHNISINARLTLDLHSLNNEGGEGNQIQTRMVNIVDAGGELHNVNAVSGDMFKHIQAEHLFHLARSRQLPMCAGCAMFNANRINADPDFIKRADAGKWNDAETITNLLRACAIDDIEGILITEGKRSVPRKSVIEFGWVVGVPEQVNTDSYFHVKYANERGSERRSEDRESQQNTGANLGQAIFHRPASSGVYAAVCHLELARIGFNDITQEYVIGEDERLQRAQALLESVLYTFIQPKGAMRSAQAPHIVNVEGVVAMSQSSTPAPTVSPLKASYREEIDAITTALAPISGDSVSVARFDDMGGLTEIMAYLVKNGMPSMMFG